MQRDMPGQERREPQTPVEANAVPASDVPYASLAGVSASRTPTSHGVCAETRHPVKTLRNSVNAFTPR